MALAVAGGYVLGRSKKMKLAIMLGGLAAGKRIGSSPAELLMEGRLALLRLEEAMSELQDHFGLAPADLDLDLGPLGTLLGQPRE